MTATGSLPAVAGIVGASVPVTRATTVVRMERRSIGKTLEGSGGSKIPAERRASCEPDHILRFLSYGALSLAFQCIDISAIKRRASKENGFIVAGNIAEQQSSNSRKEVSGRLPICSPCRILVRSQK